MNKIKTILSIFVVVSSLICNAYASLGIIDYTQAPLVKPDIPDLFDEYQKGQRMRQELSRMREEQRQLELQNEIMEEQLKALKKSNR